MKYLSTRGEVAGRDFADVLLAGLAGDGGLYLPETWPQLAGEDIATLAGLPYARAAERVIAPFIGNAIPQEALRHMLDDAYAGFRHPAVTPLVQIGPADWLLELFHGHTLAFKDVAMQLLSRLMDHVLEARSRRATIIGATSGDTGGAAIEAFRGAARADLFILYPHGRVSEVQRRQMTCAAEANVHALAIEGTFDDCQRIVKALFADEDLRRNHSLSGVNSINWARIVAQIVYYVTAAAALGAPHRRIAFTVPTGNFGDVFAGHAARRMGLDIERLVVATNVNDILARTLATGRYEVRDVIPTASPSMDIQVSSNFERLLFEATGGDAGRVRGWMASLGGTGAFAIDDDALAAIRAGFEAVSVNEAECAAAIARLHTETGRIVDPHTAVGLAAAARARKPETPMITLATAHPAKFPEAVEAACGVRPALPDSLADLHQRKERYTVLPADAAAIAAHIREHARPAAAEASA